MVDSFPSTDADADRAMQMRIDADLRHARRLNDEFERRFPVDPSANVRTLTTRALNHPTPSALFAQLASGAEQGGWLLPLLRRFEWNRARGEAGAVWAMMLAEMIGFALSAARTISEQEFVALAGAGEELLEGRGHSRFLTFLSVLAGGLDKAGPLTAAAADGVRRLLRLCDGPRGNVDEQARLIQVLFRSGAASESDGLGWSARVRADIASMPPKPAADMLKAFEPAPRVYQAAIRRLGSAELEAGLRRWLRMLRETPEPMVSAHDAIVFRHAIILCETLGGPACDELLFEIARTPWTVKPEHAWMYRYLEILRHRPKNQAFACFEALMMNPATASPEVRVQYEALLAVFGAEGAAETPVGVDGFPLDSDPLLTAQHRRIDQLLGMAAAAAAKGRHVDPSVAAHLGAMQSLKEEDVSPAGWSALKLWAEQMTRPLPWFPVAPEVDAARKTLELAILEEFSGDPASLNRAVTKRAEWIKAHQQEYSKDTLQLWGEWLHGLGCSDGLVGRSLAKVDELDLESMLAAIRAGGNSSKVFELCQKYVAKHGWHVDLVEPFRQFIPRLGVPCNQTENARAEWFLWFEDVAPIKVEDCWSYRVKADIRAMPRKESAAWRALLDNTTFTVTGTPPAKWTKAAEKRFPEVGVESFRRCFLKWFEPFAKGEPLRITITGRNILRVLIWYVLIAKDEEVDRSLLGFANARWKTKQFAKRVAQAEMAFSIVVAKREPKAALPILEGLVASGQAFKGSTTHGIYLGLCEREKRTPVDAMLEKANEARKPDPNPILDNMTVGEFQGIVERMK